MIGRIFVIFGHSRQPWKKKMMHLRKKMFLQKRKKIFLRRKLNLQRMFHQSLLTRMLRGRTIELLEIGWGRWVWSLGVFRELVVCMMARDQRQCSKFLVGVSMVTREQIDYIMFEHV